ncbi:tripartite tricarboxylate transporter TctB family protein [Algihabitans albus]|uniref:tripartite tricarboxylate transporter TctB family protein n=1 Tax=Algihabitans albus TaxID=2164067 RepID=UPI000E5D442D|nr:tripartite tricarboxylate transporter TctB family protein [Algihabitans albus]
MKIADWALGLLLTASGAVVLWEAQSFPSPVGQLYGAAFFPTIVGSGMALVGVLMSMTGLRKAKTGVVRFDEWHPNAATLARLALPIGITLAIIFVMPHAGFLATATVSLIVFQVFLGVRWLVALPIALIGAVVISYVFGTLLRVALPYGPLEALLS